MKRLTLVARKNNSIAELGYAVFNTDGLVVYNGSFGIRYSPFAVKDMMMNLVKEHGAFAIPDVAELRKCVELLDGVCGIKLDKDKANLIFSFKKNKGRLSVPVIFGLNEDLVPHFTLPWIDFEEGKGTGFAIVEDVWREAGNLISNDGEAMFGNSLGLYGRNKRLMSFDGEAFIVSKKEVAAPDFFCPREVLKLGMTSMAYVKKQGDNFFVVGEDFQYVATNAVVAPVVDDIAKMQTGFDASKVYTIKLDSDSGIWSRGKRFASSLIQFKIKDGKVVVGFDRWWEEIGTTNLPNAEFLTRLSLLERWITGTLSHSVAISEDNQWFLHGESRKGFLFYARLTDVNNPSSLVEDGNSLLSGLERNEEDDIAEDDKDGFA